MASIILLSGYSVLMLFYYFGWTRTPLFKPEKNSPQTKVSVVIAARNEETTIGSCIQSILHQDYPPELYEVIVVDDHSLVPVPARKGRNVRALPLPATAKGKKQAIAYGIQHAAGDLIITTDADCVVQNTWLSTVVAYYEKYRPKMIAAPVAFTDEQSWLEKWQSLDLCAMMAVTAGAIANGFPNMCNGANLAYEKKVFEEAGGFHGIDRQPGGDDVFLMLRIAKKYPGGVRFLKSQDAIVFTRPEKTLSGLFQQRLRWLSKGTAYPDWRVSAVLVFSWLFNVSILANLFMGIFRSEFLAMGIISLVFKTLSEFPLLAGGCDFFRKKKMLWGILPAQAMHILYVAVAGGASRFVKYNWKGRVYPAG
ncbi:MAG TPA: glycosyltransferase [Chitinophagales bacterium]|nr:glycosyltransferase [Chitinophagales bacterium]